MNIVLIVFAIISAIVFFVTCYRWRQLKPYNQAPLKIETFDGLDSPFHPSVLYFKDGWNGWRYWMVETPFSPLCKPYVDRNECPSIHVSNDGINWTTPEGLRNPLVNFGADGEQNLDYYSDPHLVMVGDRMECWYRLTQRHGDVDHRYEVSLRRVCSVDGVNWTDEEIISRLWQNGPNEGLGKMVVSQALTYHRQTGYAMWYVNSEDQKGPRQIALSHSTDGYNWSNATICSLNGPSINPWHIDVQEISDGSFLMIIYDLHELTLWKSQDGIKWAYCNKLLSPSNAIGSFYRIGLYRSCIVEDDSEIKVYFSAYDYYHTYIGLGTLTTQYDSLELKSGQNLSFPTFIIINIIEEIKHFYFIINHSLNSCLK